MLAEALGRTNAHSRYIYLSDGGHFENLGAYELIRRRCRFILLCDAGADPDFGLVELGNLVRKVRIDLGVRIDIDVDALRPHGANRNAASHIAVGKIRYGDVDRQPGTAEANEDDDRFDAAADEGLLVYIKPGLTGDEPPDLQNYSKLHPTFPHEATLDQFFTESQFESYRSLGYHSAKAAFCDAVLERARGEDGENAAACHRLFKAVFDYWAVPPSDAASNYLETSRRYIAVQEALRREERLRWLSAEIYPQARGSQDVLRAEPARSADVLCSERHMVVQMLTVLEDAWFGLRLDRYPQQYNHRGWMGVFYRWLASSTVRENWEVIRGEFSPEFQKFVNGFL